jgi:hypothetical protein
MVRYSFLVRLSHPLLHAGLSRRILDHLVRPRQHVGRNRQANLLGSFEIDDEIDLTVFPLQGPSPLARLAGRQSSRTMRRLK